MILTRKRDCEQNRVMARETKAAGEVQRLAHGGEKYEVCVCVGNGSISGENDIGNVFVAINPYWSDGTGIPSVG